ncbi:hypothetical protein TNCV_130471 [Trichonephila clavipes]|nr:hypothetical protein TNCV_130471 [Trichonephila clavipes]
MCEASARGGPQFYIIYASASQPFDRCGPVNVGSVYCGPLREMACLELVDSESVSLAQDCDRSETATSVDGTPCTEDQPNSLFRSLEISSAVSAC